MWNFIKSSHIIYYQRFAEAFYDNCSIEISESKIHLVNFSYIDNETFEESYVSVPEQGSSTLIPDGMCNPGQVYTVSNGKNGMIGLL